MDRGIGRKSLPHELPFWLNDSAREIYFITICTRERKGSPLLQNEIALNLLEAIRYYQSSGKWWTEAALVMPDHLHMLTYFPKT